VKKGQLKRKKKIFDLFEKMKMKKESFLSKKHLLTYFRLKTLGANPTKKLVF